MPKPKVSSFADDLASVLHEQPDLQPRSFADDLADVEAEQTRPYAGMPHRTTDIDLPVEPVRRLPTLTAMPESLPPEVVPVTPAARKFWQPGEATQQIAHGVGQLRDAMTDLSLVPPSNEPFRRSRTGTLYQPPPPIDRRVYAGAADIAEGGMELSKPLVAVAGVTAPLETGAALLKATVAAKGTEKLLSATGADPDATRLAGDIVGAVAAGVPIADTIIEAGRYTRAAGDAAAARRAAARTIEPLPTDIPAEAVRPSAPDVPVTPIVEPPAAPPAPVEPIADVGRPGGSFADDLADVTRTTVPEISTPGEIVPAGENLTGEIRPDEGSFAADLAAVQTGPKNIPEVFPEATTTFAEDLRDVASEEGAKPEAPPTFAEDLKQVTEPETDIPGKPGQLNVPAEKVPYETVTDEQRHELRRVLQEMTDFDYTPKTFNETSGRGSDKDVVAGERGARVFDDINTQDRNGRTQGTRGDVIAKIRAFLYDGKRSAVSDRAMDVVKRRLAGDKTLSPPSLPPAAGDLPYGMALKRRLDLADEERRVEDTFARQIERNPSAAISDYKQRFDNVFNSDLAKELAGEKTYGPPATRTKNSRALHMPSHELAHAAFRDALTDDVPEGRSNIAVFTAGGTGSGKSTSVDKAFPGLPSRAHVIYDSTFANTEGAIADVQAALDTGHEAIIVYTKRDIRDAFRRGVLPRAMREGRPVAIASHVRTHLGALETIRAAVEHFKDDDRVSFAIVDNNQADESRDIVALGNGRDLDLSSLEGVRYDPDSVRAQLEADLEAEVKAGRVSESVAVSSRDVRRQLAAETPAGGPRRVQRGQEGQRREVKPKSQTPNPKSQSAAPAIGPQAYRALPHKPAAGGAPDQRLRPSAIIERLRKTIGAIPNRTGRFTQRALGIYKIEPQTIRLKLANDLQTFAHEAGHHVSLGILKLNRKDPRWKKELERLGAATSRPSYTKDTVRKEGEAEFLRMWLTEPHMVQRAAPNYYAAFEEALKAHPEMAKGLREAQADVRALIATDPADRAKLHINFEGNEDTFIALAKEDPRRAIREIASATIDDLQPLRDAVEQMRDGRELPFRQNAYVLARIARGAAGKAEAFLEHGVRMRNGKFAGPSFADAIQPVHDRLEDFWTYMVALRSEEMASRGMESGLSRGEAKAVIERIDSDPRVADFTRARDNVYAFQAAGLEYARQYGAMSGEQLKAIHLANEFYVPMGRVFNASEAAYTGAAKRIADRALPVKRIKGSGRDVINPAETIVSNTFALVDMVEKNRAMIALTNQANESIGSGRWLERIPDPQVATRFNLQKVTSQVRDALDEAGVDVPDNLDEALDELVTVFTPATFGRADEQIVTVIRKGKRQFWQVNEPSLYKAITAMGPQTSSMAVSWFKKPVGILRAGATLNPGFILRNPGRDTIVAYFQSRYGFIPVYDTMRGLISQLRGDKDARQFFASGVAQASLAGQHRRHRRELVEKITKRGGSFTRYIVRHPIDLLRAVSEQMEVATRLGEFKLALEAGGVEQGIAKRVFGRKQPAEINEETLTRATLAARDVTTDFARAGKLAREINEFKAFFNAGVQGYVRGYETVKRDPAGVAMKLGALALFTAALWWMNHDDDEIRDKKDWEKRSYWFLRLVPGLPPIQIPKPFEWGYVPDIVEATLGYLHEKDPDALKEIIPGANGQMWKQVAFSLVPTAIAPLLEASVNYDMFRDAPVIPEGEQGLDPELQYNQWTSETAKKLGAVMHMSPLLIDHIIYGYGAGLGRITTSGVDAELRQVGLAPADKRPQRREETYPVIGPVTNWPIIGPFADSAINAAFSNESGLDSRYIQDLYEAAAAIEQFESSVKQYVKAGDRDRALERVREFRDDEPWAGRREQIKAAAAAFRDLRPTIKAIYAAPVEKMSPAEKRRRLGLIRERMNAIAKTALGKPQHHEDVQGDVLHQLGMGR